MKLFKKILLALLILFIAIQFIRPERNLNAAVLPMDISRTVHVSDTVMDILKNCCYDCHSNNTRYPWYANVQPVAWWLNSHIHDGKRALNFSEFGSYPLRRQQNKFKGMNNEVQSGDMPLTSYTLIHTTAKLNAEEKKIIADWTITSAEAITHKN